MRIGKFPSPHLQPHPELDVIVKAFVSNTADEDQNNDVTSSKITEDLSARAAKKVDNGSDGGTRNKSKMQEQRSVSTQRPTGPTPKPSLSSLHTVKSRTDPPLRNMTVETETVPSVAQTAIGNQDRSASGRGDGSLRLKPSNETIRPRKERKPAKRKAQSIHSGTASSKADVFEQKVASEVNEADSSDSDATFIYESNPPDHGPHRSRQHGQHSRTPSMTSIVSLVDPRLAIRNEHKNPDKKPSMKFPNPYNNGNGEYDGNGDGTVRAGSARSGGSRHHHHIGRHSQTRGGLHHLVMDSDSSLVGSSRIRAPSSRHPSQPNSPRFQTFNVINGTGNGNGNGTRKQGELSTYEIDTENAADDERTPLIQVRSPRVRGSRHGRPGSATLRHLEHRNRRRGEGNWCRRFAGCLVASVIILVVVFTAVGVVFASTKQLTDLKISEIQNVVASQEEIIMDLVVGAVNPNIIGITVSDMDILMFAKSKHVGSDQWWREHGDGTPKNEEGWLPIQPSSRSKDQLDIAGVDEGTDPAEEPHTMWLGQIDHFDSPLTFDGTFFNHRRIESVGEIRLSKPGNKTEAGGTARWEEVLQYPFELIVRGTLKYELPLSTHVHKVSVTASYEYDPDAEKKKLKLMGSKSVKEKRRNLSSLPVISAPVGRYDRRMLPHLSWPFAR
ncbi:hypothetical protein BU23DRAFT_101139 [Bimuria novae-zelandiae CBS 107.79]|uniref:Uncharacterized protein n=1 Tax=Bimuria novae-zelandiae CBS 107.79 TaxID=1447943 RepID=A0A6A5VQS5_9PLEO|nr:hypothetical protein BU23DRAFT_101139 [Bimuria novae-zelandiae CBS 107.79]